MKKTKISKEIKAVRSKKDYNIHYIFNEMKTFYYENNFDEKFLLERLHQLKTEKLYMDSFQGGLIGSIVGLITIIAGETAPLIDILKAGFEFNLFLGIFMIIAFLLLLAVSASAIVFSINLLKFLYYKVVKSDVTKNFLDEKEIELIDQILNDRINRLDKLIEL